MTREHLESTASALSPPSPASRTEFSEKREHLAGLVNERQVQRPDLEKLIGADGQKMSEDNNRNFSMFMESLFAEYKAEVFIDTVLWVFRAYRAHGFQTVYWAANLGAWLEILKAELSETSFDEIKPYYSWLVTNIPTFVKLTDEFGTIDVGSAQPEH